MFPPGPDFSRFLQEQNPGFKTFNGIEVLDPCKQPVVKNVVTDFCSRFYGNAGKRVLILGINPGRKGGGLTGIPFTDPVALQEICGISNEFKKERELSSSFIYSVVDALGGPTEFYNKILLSAVCPVGFVLDQKNFNYYDDPKLLQKLNAFIESSFQFHAELDVYRTTVISLGKENGAIIQAMNDKLGLFNDIVILEHPRFIMQYKRSLVNKYIDKYRDVIGAVIT